MTSKCRSASESEMVHYRESVVTRSMTDLRNALCKLGHGLA